MNDTSSTKYFRSSANILCSEYSNINRFRAINKYWQNTVSECMQSTKPDHKNAKIKNITLYKYNTMIQVCIYADAHVVRQQQLSIDICCEPAPHPSSKPAADATAVGRWDRQSFCDTYCILHVCVPRSNAYYTYTFGHDNFHTTNKC